MILLDRTCLRPGVVRRIPSVVLEVQGVIAARRAFHDDPSGTGLTVHHIDGFLDHTLPHATRPRRTDRCPEHHTAGGQRLSPPGPSSSLPVNRT